jgi:hypothetical protein
MPCHSARYSHRVFMFKLLIAPPKHILARAPLRPPRVLIPHFSCIAAVIAGHAASVPAYETFERARRWPEVSAVKREQRSTINGAYAGSSTCCVYSTRSSSPKLRG